jgi:hypothetical protein
MRPSGYEMQFDRMKRREFIILVGGATVSWPWQVEAQQGAPKRIGVLTLLSSRDEEKQRADEVIE